MSESLANHKENFAWPPTPFHVALVEPEIPPNTGNIARLCAATGTPLHLVGQLGFRITDKSLKRAGLDYWDSVNLVRHKDMSELQAALPLARFLYFSTKGAKIYTRASYKPGDVLVFGSERTGLPEELLNANPENVFTIPMRKEAVRSLNLATSVGIVLYEALRHASQLQQQV